MNKLPDHLHQLYNSFKLFKEKDFTFSHKLGEVMVQNYSARIKLMLKDSDWRKRLRLLIDVSHVQEFDEKHYMQLIYEPEDLILAWEHALQETINEEFPDEKNRAINHPGINLNGQGENIGEQIIFKIGFYGAFGSHRVSPRNLLSRALNHLVCVEGIVTKITTSFPEIVKSIHYCPATGKHSQRTFRSQSNAYGLATQQFFPTKDVESNPLETEFGLCIYKDVQKIYLQEMPENAPAGQLPRSVEILLQDDLVETAKPGDRIMVVGRYSPFSTNLRAIGSGLKGTMKTVVFANYLEQLGNQTQMPKPSEIRLIRKVKQESENIFEQLSESIAPSIFGHKTIKQSLLLQMVGGQERVLEHGIRLRGDVNILLVGDPGTAKSQLLRFMMKLAPLSVSTSGRSSTGVGLTAAVVQDSVTQERALQAGAMVLADRGLVCIDEFDKMNEVDRAAMHEVMEQQTVTIQKAGVHARLNARTSVLAAANPIYSQYRPDLSVQRNINLPDSLLSRFDLVFIVLDKKDQFVDRDIAHHVLNIHRHVPNQSDGYKSSLTSKGKSLFSTDFLRKYILYAKFSKAPKITLEAEQLIRQKYVDLRSNDLVKTVPITPRTLETLVRLSTAHARCRLSRKVEIQDVQKAHDIMQYALCFNYEEDEPTIGFETFNEENGNHDDTDQQNMDEAVEGEQNQNESKITEDGNTMDIVNEDSSDDNDETEAKELPEPTLESITTRMVKAILAVQNKIGNSTGIPLKDIMTALHENDLNQDLTLDRVKKYLALDEECPILKVNYFYDTDQEVIWPAME